MCAFVNEAGGLSEVSCLFPKALEGSAVMKGNTFPQAHGTEGGVREVTVLTVSSFPLL